MRSGSTIPQTLPPRVLEILQYRDLTHEHTLSDTALDDDRKTAAGGPSERLMSTPESRVTIPRIVVQTDDSVASDGSSFTVVDGPEGQRPTPADSGTNHRTSDARDNREAYGRGSSDARKVRDTGELGPQQLGQRGQQPGRPSRLTRAYDLPVLPSFKADRDPATLNLKPPGEERTPSVHSGMRKSECMVLICDHALWPT